MTTDIVITTAHNDYRLNGTLTFLNLGAGVATVEIYGNTRALTPGDPAGTTPLVIIELADPAGAVEDGELVLEPAEDAIIDTTGTATWARIKNGNGDVALDCDVSVTAGTALIRLPNLELYAGGATRLLTSSLG